MIQKVFDAMYLRLQVPGKITSHAICRRISAELMIGEEQTKKTFRFIMFQLLAIGKVKYIKRCHWEILEPCSIDSIPALDQRASNTYTPIDYSFLEEKAADPASDAAMEFMLYVDRPAEQFIRIAFWIAEEYGVSIQSLVIALVDIRRRKRPAVEMPEAKAIINPSVKQPYEFKNNVPWKK